MPPLLPADYSHTPTPLPPPPRRVRAQLGVFRKILFFLYLAAMIWAAGYFFLILSAFFFGTDIPAQVAYTRIFRGKQDTYCVEFSYFVAGVAHDGSANVSRETYDHFTAALHD